MRERLGSLLSPLRIALVYLVFGTLALFLSDVLLVLLVGDGALLRQLQALKGLVEVALTAVLIYALVATYSRATAEKTREVERARDRFALLNRLLRHHVLNRMNVVQGQVDRLIADGTGDSDRLETVRRQSAAVVDLVENVRALAGPDEAGFEPHRVDLSELLSEELSRARSRHPAARVDGAVPAGVQVAAGDSLSLVFEELLDNAVEHNPSAEPTVQVDVDVGESEVAVRVLDDGPGLPANALGDPAGRERRGHEGMGLLLARTLVDRYGGDLRVGSDEDGGLVEVTLRRHLDGR